MQTETTSYTMMGLTNGASALLVDIPLAEMPLTDSSDVTRIALEADDNAGRRTNIVLLQGQFPPDVLRAFVYYLTRYFAVCASRASVEEPFVVQASNSHNYQVGQTLQTRD